MAEGTSVFKSAHFIGIGGAGMSGIALVLHERGCKVTGSDLKASRYVRELENAGVKVYVGHEASTIDEVAPDVVVISTAIPETNPSSCVPASLAFPCGRAPACCRHSLMAPARSLLPEPTARRRPRP